MKFSFNAKLNEFTTNIFNKVYILNNIFINAELTCTDAFNRKRFWQT